jgi:hypothetical protein
MLSPEEPLDYHREGPRQAELLWVSLFVEADSHADERSPLATS